MLENYKHGTDMSRAANQNKRNLSRVHPSKDMIELLFDSIGRGVIFTNLDGVVTHMNSAAEEMLHAERTELIGKKVYMLPLRTPVYKVLSDNYHDTPVEVTVMGRVYAVLSSEVKNRQGLLLGEMTEIWDITEQRKEKRQGEEFVAMITHDLKSPVTVINGYLQMLKMGVYGPLREKLDNVVAQMEMSGERLLSMIEELLEVYQMEMGNIRINREACNIGEFLEECYRDNLNDACDRGIELIFSLGEVLPQINADGKQLTRVFNNLIGNAIKFTPNGGTVTVTAYASGESLLISVADTGIGIPWEDLSKLFNKYFRSATASGYKGTGLGLAISKAIVEGHGGTIEVESIEGKGCKFTVMLELTED